MSNRSVNIGGNAKGNVIQTGDNNQANLNYREVALPPAENVNIGKELAAIREILAKLQSSDQKKINNAVEEAQDEAKKDKPNKDEVGGALERAMKYAKQAGTFSTIIETLKPHVLSASAWLGENWYHLTKAIGM